MYVCYVCVQSATYGTARHACRMVRGTPSSAACTLFPTNRKPIHTTRSHAWILVPLYIHAVLTFFLFSQNHHFHDPALSGQAAVTGVLPSPPPNPPPVLTFIAIILILFIAQRVQRSPLPVVLRRFLLTRALLALSAIGKKAHQLLFLDLREAAGIRTPARTLY